MFDEGTLLYFEPFIFKNGAPSKNKFFLVLHNDGQNTLLASLPTSRDHIPATMPVRSGVYEYPNMGVSAYVFLADEEFATTFDSGERFSFQKNTFIYGEQLDTFPESEFSSQVASGLTKIRVIGKVDDDVLKTIKEFLKNSAMVKGKFKKLL